MPEPQHVPGYAAPQLDAADLKRMAPDAVVEAKRSGQLDRLLGIQPRPAAVRLAAGEQLDRDDLHGLSPDEVLEAKARGQLDSLLGITTTPNF